MISKRIRRALLNESKLQTYGFAQTRGANSKGDQIWEAHRELETY